PTVKPNRSNLCPAVWVPLLVAVWPLAVNTRELPPTALLGTNTTIQTVPVCPLPDRPVAPFWSSVIVGRGLLVGIMALLFPQSDGLAPVPQRWMLVGSSGGAPSSCAAAHDTSKKQQSNTPQEKVAFFTRTSSSRRICNPSGLVMCNQIANLGRLEDS